VDVIVGKRFTWVGKGVAERYIAKKTVEILFRLSEAVIVTNKSLET
jgi:hypothetical protein